MLTEERAWMLENAAALDNVEGGVIDETGTCLLETETTLAENTGGGVLLGMGVVQLVGGRDELGCGALEEGSISESRSTKVGSCTPW